MHQAKSKQGIEIKKIAAQVGIRFGEASVALLCAALECGIDIAMLMSRGKREMSNTARPNEVRSVWDYLEEIKNHKHRSVQAALYRLKEKGLISSKENILTSKGRKLVRLIVQKIDEEIEREKEWDGKFRLISFDIPEKTKKHREWLVRQLNAFGFVRFQKSVFIGKFPISEDMYQKIADRNLGVHIRLLTVGDIDDEAVLKQLE